jgi:hypothetical protein
MSSRSARSVVASLLCVAFLAGGCRSVPGVSRVQRALGLESRDAMGFTQTDLRLELAAYAASFDSRIVAAAEEIASASSDVEIQRRALLWKVRMIPAVNEAAFVPDTLRAYVAVATLAEAMRQYLVEGAGRDLYGPQQPIAVGALDEVSRDAGQIGALFLTSAQQADLRAQVEALARANPIRGVWVFETANAVVEASEPGGPFDWVVGVPLSPFRALEGVDAGAQAVRELNVTAWRFNQILAAMPRVLRWNIELLSYELEQRPGVESARASFAELARSSDVLARAAETLPETLRGQASLLIQQLEESQGELRRTLADARGLLGEADVAAQDFAPVAAALERTATEAARAGVAWTALVQEARKPGPEARPGEESRPFDILEYERTAAQIAAAAGETRGLLAEVRMLDETMDQVASGGRSLVNLAAWRGLQLMLAFFALLFVYRRIESRLAAGRAAGRNARDA